MGVVGLADTSNPSFSGAKNNIMNLSLSLESSAVADSAANISDSATIGDDKDSSLSSPFTYINN